MSGFAEKLNVRNYVNSTKNCVHYTFEMSGFEEKLIVQSCTNSMGVRNVWICRKIECPNCGNSTGNCVHYICTEWLDL